MSLYTYFRPQGHHASIYGRTGPHRPTKVVVAPSDDDVRRRLSRFRLIMSDGPVPVEAKLIGYRRTDAGALGGIFANPLTNRRELFGLDFVTRRPRFLAVL